MQQYATIIEPSFTHNADLKPARRLGGRPIHRMLVSFSAAYFTGALVTDLAYWQMPDVMWERFSIWLIAAGLIMAGLAAVAYVIDLAGRRANRQAGVAPRDRLRARCLARADQRLRSQPRRLHGSGTDRPDAFRACRRRSRVDGPGWQGPGKSPSCWSMIMMHTLRNCTLGEAAASRRSLLSPSPALDSPAVTIMPATRKCRSAPIPCCPRCSNI